jgi:hypothetical protein
MDSVILSCSKSDNFKSVSAEVALAAEALLKCNEYTSKRSIRRTIKPQLWAMSVAFEAQGETVPSLGDTKI